MSGVHLLAILSQNKIYQGGLCQIIIFSDQQSTNIMPQKMTPSLRKSVIFGFLCSKMVIFYYRKESSGSENTAWKCTYQNYFDELYDEKYIGLFLIKSDL